MAIEKNEHSTVFTGVDIDVYAFMTCRRAVRFRVKTGQSLMRGQELKMARNWGWTRERQAIKVLADLDRIYDELIASRG